MELAGSCRSPAELSGSRLGRRRSEEIGGGCFAAAASNDLFPSIFFHLSSSFIIIMTISISLLTDERTDNASYRAR